MAGYNADTGAELWATDCGGSDDSPSPAFGNEIAISSHSNDKSYAVRTDGKGKVKTIWNTEDPVEASSPVVVGDIAYIALEAKIVALDLTTGKQLWEKEVDEKAYASLVAVGDKVFFISQGGKMLIFQAGKEYKELGTADVGEGTDSTPAIANGKIYIRGSSNLLCFGAK
jgi:outer membrane protein assembly factor BamB